MTDTRKAVRAAIVAALKDQTRAETRVFPSRIRDIWRETLPAIAVFTKSSDHKVDSYAPREYLTTAQVMIELYLEQRYDSAGVALGVFDDELDAFSAEVEKVLGALQLVNPVRDMRLVRSEISTADEGQRELIAERKTIEVDYFETPCGPDPGDLAEFLKLNVRIDLPGKGEVTTLQSPTTDSETQTTFPRP